VHRSFYEKNYQTVKMLNPRMPFLIRPSENAAPYVIARYGRSRDGWPLVTGLPGTRRCVDQVPCMFADWNEKKTVELEGMDEAAVEAVFEKLTLQGQTMPRSPESLDTVKLPTVTE